MSLHAMFTRITQIFYIASLMGLLSSPTVAAPNETPLIAAKYFAQENRTWELQGVEHSKAIGLALAGGGTRASQYAIGVLKGLNDSGILEHVTHLSTVSGGSYAGYWYVTQKLKNASNAEIFRDCVPKTYEKIATRLIPAIKKCTPENWEHGPCICPGTEITKKEIKNNSNILISRDGNEKFKSIADPYRYQNHLRGHTDIFLTDFDYTNKSTLGLIATSALPGPLHSNIIFSGICH